MFKLKRKENGDICDPREWTEINPKLSMLSSSLLVILKQIVSDLNSAYEDYERYVRVNLHIYAANFAAPPKCANNHRSKYACEVIVGDLLPFLCENEECSARLREAMDLFESTRAYKNLVEDLLRQEETYHMRAGDILFEISELVDEEQTEFLKDIGLSYTYQSVTPTLPWPALNNVVDSTVYELLRAMRNPYNFGFSICTHRVRQVDMSQDMREHYITMSAQHALHDRTRSMGKGFPHIVFTGEAGASPPPSLTDSDDDDEVHAMAHPQDGVRDDIDELDEMTDEE